ncbi:MAG: hypothetical protein PHV42_03060 [Candidatus Pacebacteria bacterium]|nr:hypothetical protein [Candidatus Paceibacterota bacterium]
MKTSATFLTLSFRFAVIAAVILLIQTALSYTTTDVKSTIYIATENTNPVSIISTSSMPISPMVATSPKVSPKNIPVKTDVVTKVIKKIPAKITPTPSPTPSPIPSSIPLPSQQIVILNATTSETVIAGTSTEISATSTENIPKSATTTLDVQLVPLLSGGIVHAGKSVPISYLQITNVGTEPAYLRGFFVKQNGSAPDLAIIGLTTVDDRGASRGFAGGIEGSTPFKDGLAFAPITNGGFAPGQMRLFTIKAMLTKNVSFYLGEQLMIDVASIDTNATMVSGQFPIRGTTWTIAN